MVVKSVTLHMYQIEKLKEQESMLDGNLNSMTNIIKNQMAHEDRFLITNSSTTKSPINAHC